MTDPLKDAYALIGAVSGTLWIISLTVLIFVAQDRRKEVTNATAGISAYAVGIGNLFLLAMLGAILSLIPKVMWGEVSAAVYVTMIGLGLITLICTLAAASWALLLVKGVPGARKLRISANGVGAATINIGLLVMFLVRFNLGSFGIGFIIWMLGLGCVLSVGIGLTLVLSASADRAREELPELERQIAASRQLIRDLGGTPPPR